MSAPRATQGDELLSPSEAADAALIDRAFSGAPQPLPNKAYRTLVQFCEFVGLTRRQVLRLVEDGTLEAYVRPEVGIMVYDDDLERAFEREGAQRVPGPTGLNHRDRWEPDERDYALMLLADPCSYCGVPTEAIDHIEARAAGGDHAWPNLTAACRRCNSIKGARGLLWFLARRVA